MPMLFSSRDSMARRGGIVAALLAPMLVLGACGQSASSSDSATPPPPISNAVEDIPACTPEQLNNLQWINNNTANRPDLENLNIAWQGKYVDNAEAMSAAKQTTMLPCDPKVSLDNIAAAPPNVQTVDRVLGLDKWTTLINPATAGTGQGNGPAPSGFQDPRASYTTFLNLIGRFPYICGEAGTWDSVDAACQREIASIIGNAAQETGAHAGPIDEQYKQALTYTREMNCYPANCTQYDGDAAAWGAPADAHFFGRGMHQLSYAYNYGPFSAIVNQGDHRVLIDNPDLVGSDPELILGSGLWFHTSPAAPKPSPHQVLVGTYKPAKAAAGIQTAPDGSVINRFEVVNSIINGGVECSTSNANAQEQSKNRFRFYKQTLQTLGAQLTPEEQAITEGVTWCSTIPQGNPFGDPQYLYDIAYRPPMYLDTTPGGNCQVISWQPNPPLPAAAPNMYDTCMKMFFPQGAQ